MRRPIHAFIGFISLTLTSLSSASDFTITYSEPLDNLQWISSESAAYAAKPDGAFQSSGLSELQFEALGRRFDVVLQPNRALVRQMLGDAASPKNYGVFTGTIKGMPNSWARLVVADGQPEGMLFDGADFYALEKTEQGGAKIFKLADLHIARGAIGCGDPAHNHAEHGQAFAAVIGDNVVPERAAGATREITIAVTADEIFSIDNGSNTEAAVLARMNIVDGIFSEQIGVQMTVARFDQFPNGGDPFSETTDASDLLGELGNYRRNTPSQNQNGLSHLFTGRDLDGTTAGIAYRGGLCSSRFSAGLTQATRTTTTDSLIAAHEFGHNFGAPHDDEADSACESTPRGFLMSPSINGSDQFSNCSLEQINNEIADASCISALQSRDVTVNAGAPSAQVLLGAAGTVDFDINSNGTEPVSNASADITIPGGVTFSGVTTTTGSCSSGASGVSCSFGSLAAGSGATVTLDFTADAVGAQVFTAIVSADLDDNRFNNEATDSVTVLPAVDLRAIPASAATIEVDAQATISPAVENRTSINASDIIVRIEPDAGLRIDSADWSIGACTVAGDGTLQCEASALAANATSTIDVTVTGTATGSQGYRVTVAAAEADTDASNDAAIGTVTVNAAGSGGSSGGGNSGSGPNPITGSSDDGGGGGAIGPMLLGLFAITLGLRCRRYR
ncbi:MAG: M12 family metallo-peptidase [Pseudomonadota bacterium]